MKRSKTSAREVSQAERRELEMAAAVARDAVVQLHATRALRMIDLAQGQVSAPRMIEIYVRLTSLHSGEAVGVANRALATLGRRDTKDGLPVLFVEGEEDEGITQSFSLVSAVRDRLRGRVNHGLRRNVELHIGATQMALIDLHVRHALEFVAKLQETHPLAKICSMYSDMTGVPVHLKEYLYMSILDKLADAELPKPAAKPARVAKLSTESSRRPKAV